eukprot:365052-Chlamydomonas_euryale.AAC.5
MPAIARLRGLAAVKMAPVAQLRPRRPGDVAGAREDGERRRGFGYKRGGGSGDACVSESQQRQTEAVLEAGQRSRGAAGGSGGGGTRGGGRLLRCRACRRHEARRQALGAAATAPGPAARGAKAA